MHKSSPLNHLAGYEAYAHGVEFAAGLGGFWSLGVALDQLAEFVDAGIFFVQLNQSQSFSELRGGGFRAAAEAFKDGVVVFYCSGIILLTVGNFAEIEFG